MGNRTHWYYDHPPACTCTKCHNKRRKVPARSWVWVLIVLAAVGGWLARDRITPAIPGLQASSSVSDCAPTRANGRQLTDGEWNLVIAFSSDEQQQVSRQGVTSELGSFSWCELRDHPIYSTAYWWFVEDIDSMINVAAFFCVMDEETLEVTCPDPFAGLLPETDPELEERTRAEMDEMTRRLEEQFGIKGIGG